MEFEGFEVVCSMFDFKSDTNDHRLINTQISSEKHIEISGLPDDTIKENQKFHYPVLYKNTGAKYDHAIILLHGLNEKSWIKYLTWAFFLVENTGHPVILFPIAFHMDRAPSLWGDLRKMSSFVDNRKILYGDLPFLTFVNVALSDRLTEDPLRFYNSGYQSAMDLTKLSSQLRNGDHPLFLKDTTVDFFAYSIGAFLAQILLLGNPDNLYLNSKLFMFCGGAFFNEMNGVSKHIMDQLAFRRLRNYYLFHFEEDAFNNVEMKEELYGSELGKAFVSMLASTKLKEFRQQRLNTINGRMNSISLAKDLVIPCKATDEKRNEFGLLEIQDFPFPYCHENPFPILEGTNSSLVDASFENVFGKAAKFLC